jgi:hypothetical protein
VHTYPHGGGLPKREDCFQVEASSIRGPQPLCEKARVHLQRREGSAVFVGEEAHIASTTTKLDDVPPLPTKER